MSTYEFIADLARSLAWPFVAALGALFIRWPVVALLREVLPSLEKLKFRDFEVVFDRRLTKIESNAAAIGQEGSSPSIDERIEDTFSINPRSAVIESWLTVEAAVTELARAHDIQARLPRQRSPIDLLHTLEQRGIVPHKLAAMLRDLRAVRNQVAHELEISLEPDMARRYAEAASRTAYGLRQLM